MSEADAVQLPVEEKKLQHWQKCHIDQDALVMIRMMLRLDDYDELPEKVWRTILLHKALNVRFPDPAWSVRDITNLLITSDMWVPPKSGSVKYVPGCQVTVTSIQRDGIYCFAALYGQHVVNCQGDIYLVRTDELKIHEINRIGSQEHKALQFARKIGKVKPEALEEPAHAV